MVEEFIEVVPVSDEFPFYVPKEGTKPRLYIKGVPHYRRSDIDYTGVPLDEDV